MGFKENLLKKVQIDALAKTVIDAYGPPDSGGRIDKDVMRQLLDLGGFQAIKERDLDLYILEGNKTKGKILVLDNDLAIYHTSAADVGMRKSPVVKEMLTIRSIIKILNDKDVVVSKKDSSVRTVQNRCLDMLDLSFAASDIDALAREMPQLRVQDYIKEVNEDFTEVPFVPLSDVWEEGLGDLFEDS